MPESRVYTVSETREVQVEALNASSAVLIASAAFQNGQNADNGVKLTEVDPAKARRNPLYGVWGNTISKVRQLDLNAREER